MRAHALPEVREYADLMLEELRKVIPSFLKRLDVPERGVAWTEYLRATKGATGELVSSMLEQHRDEPIESVRLVDFDPEGEQRVLEAIVFANSNASHDDVVKGVAVMGPDERTRLFAAYVGERGNRRHRPGRAFEATDYRFELVTDYGAFRDLQRHRLLSIEWQPLTVELGYDVPASCAKPASATASKSHCNVQRNCSMTCATSSPNRASTASRSRFASATRCR